MSTLLQMKYFDRLVFTAFNSLARRTLFGMLLALSVSLEALAAQPTAQPTAQPIKVVTTLPEFAEMITKIGGAEVQVVSLLKGIEDPHMVDATPAMVLQLSKADLVILAGMNLETSWLRRAIAKTGKPSIQRGGPGYLELGQLIHRLEIPKQPTDRSQGDVHAEGNPHFNLSTKALREAAKGVSDALIAMRPEKKAVFETGEANFKTEMTAVETDVRNVLAAVSVVNGTAKVAPAFLEYHREFVYFFELYGLNSFGALEEKPGLSPSSGRLAQVATMAKSNKVRRVVAGTFAPRQQLRRFTELSGIPFSIVPTMVRPGEQGASTIREMHLTIARELVK